MGCGGCARNIEWVRRCAAHKTPPHRPVTPARQGGALLKRCSDWSLQTGGDLGDDVAGSGGETGGDDADDHDGDEGQDERVLDGRLPLLVAAELLEQRAHVSDE